MRFVVLASGTGSNARALIEACQGGHCAAEPVALVSDRTDAGALTMAEDLGLPTAVLPLGRREDRQRWDQDLTEHLHGYQPDLIVLAGFMRLLGPATVKRFSGRMINVHPSLLPAFAGLRAPEQALRARVAISGCTVHVVDQGMDTGPILAQAALVVDPRQSASELHERIKGLERTLLPRVVHAIALGGLDLTAPLQGQNPVSSLVQRSIHSL